MLILQQVILPRPFRAIQRGLSLERYRDLTEKRLDGFRLEIFLFRLRFMYYSSGFQAIAAYRVESTCQLTDYLRECGKGVGTTIAMS